MLDQAIANLSKAAEATMQFQQEMFRQWVQQLGKMPDALVPGASSEKGISDQFLAFQKPWVEGLTSLLTKHRETLDAQYQAGIRTIEETFRASESRDPERYRKLAEDLWRQSFECLKTLIESQIRDYQAAAEKGFEAMSKGVGAPRS